MDLVDASMPRHTRLAVFDAVTSNTAVALPLTQLIALCKRRGIAVLIDGAHALGQLPLDMTSLEAAGVHYYVTNCHKWLCAPRGSAVMWTSAAARARWGGVQPLVVSHGSGSGYTSDFIWDGECACACHACCTVKRVRVDRLAIDMERWTMLAHKHMLHHYCAPTHLPDDGAR